MISAGSCHGANLDLAPLTDNAPRRRYGTAILSRHPILSWENTPLPRNDGHERRGPLLALVQVRGVCVQVCNTHLQHNDAGERLDQVRAIQPRIAAHSEPVVLTGDLNAGPDAPEIRALSETLTDIWTRAVAVRRQQVLSWTGRPRPSRRTGLDREVVWTARCGSRS
jgi:endonuclease/exonuclease/phosphatase family metal-dependent hydrolase